MISDSEDEISAPSKSLTEIRSDVSNTTLLVMLGFAVPAVGGSLSRIFAQGWLPVMGLHIALLAALLAVVLARHRLSYFVRAGFVVALMFTIGAGGIISFGLSTGFTTIRAGAFMALRQCGSARSVS